MNRIYFVAALAVFALMLGTTADAGTISLVDFSGDSTCGISNAKTYTHVIDFGNSPAAEINNVAFESLYPATSGLLSITSADGKLTFETGLDTRGTSYANYALAKAGGTTGTIGVSESDGCYDLLYDFVYCHGYHEGSVVTITDLNPGSTYDFRVYYRQWASSGRTVDFDFDTGSGTTDEITINEDDYAGARYLSYEYTATSTGTLTVTLTYANEDAGWHMYGVSNELVNVPEPSTFALLSAGLLGLLAYAWRKRK